MTSHSELDGQIATERSLTEGSGQGHAQLVLAGHIW